MVVRELLTYFGFGVDKAAARDASRIVTNIKGNLTQTTQAVAGMGMGIGGMLRHLGMAVGLGVFAHRLYAANAEAEMLHASLETVTGGVQEANVAFSQIRRFAATTPFSLHEVTQAFIVLANAAFDTSDRVLTALGNITIGRPGATIMDVAEAARSAVYGRTEPIRQFGIMTEVEGRKITMRWFHRGQEIVRTVDRTAQGVQEALVEMSDMKYAGGMARQMHTLTGVMSNLGDVIAIWMTSVGKAGASKDLNELLASLTELIAGEQGLAPILSALIQGPVRILTAAIKFFTKHTMALKIVLTTLVTYAVVANLGRLAGAVKAVGGFFTTAITKAQLFKAAMLGLVVGVLLLLEDIWALVTGGESALGELAEAWRGEGGLKGAIASVIDWISEHGPQIVMFVQSVVESVQDVGKTIGEALGWLFVTLDNAFNWFDEHVMMAGEWVNGIVDEIKAWIGGAVDWVMEKLDALWDKIAGIPGRIRDVFGGIGDFLGITGPSGEQVEAALAGARTRMSMAGPATPEEVFRTILPGFAPAPPTANVGTLNVSVTATTSEPQAVADATNAAVVGALTEALTEAGRQTAPATSGRLH